MLTSAYFAQDNPRNGVVIKQVAQDIARAQPPARALFIRTPTTGGWLEQTQLPVETRITRAYYAVSHQHPSEPFPSRDEFLSAMQEKVASGELFDLILVDFYHEYDHSVTDFELCWSLLSPDGVLIAHDCAPTYPEFAAPVFIKGSWGGTTYAALMTLSLRHPGLAITVLDTDTGIGILRQRGAAVWQKRLPAVERNESLLTEFQALVDARRFAEAYRFFRKHGAVLADLRTNRKHLLMRRLRPLKRRIYSALGMTPKHSVQTTSAL
ncbi:MAG: class I SAM-dependent methyltransferase [Pseudomonadales bacterium]